MKKVSYLIVLTLILGLVLTGCLLSNVGQTPVTDQSGVTCLTKALPLHDNLVGLWHFSDNLIDSSGNGNHGTFLGGGVATYSDSPMGRALSFDGINDYVLVGDIGVTGDWTVEFWANLASTNETIYYPISLSPASSTYGSGIFLAYKNDKWGVYDGVNIVWGSSVISTNTWYHFAVTKSGTVYTLYRGGTYEGAGNLADIDISDLNIGRRSDNYWYFEGIIDEVRIWNVALSEDQLDFIYKFGGILPPIKEDGLSTFKLGRTIPVKFQLWDRQDNFVTDAVANIFVKKTKNGGIGEEIDVISTAAATNGNLFRYDFSSNQYIFNLSTKLPLNDGVSWSEGTWEIRIELDDGMSYSVEIGLRP